MITTRTNITKRRRRLKQIKRSPLKQTMGLGSFAAVLALAIALLVSGKSSVQAFSDQGQVIELPKETSPILSGADSVSRAQTTRYASFGIPLTLNQNIPAVDAGLSANPEVVLTDKQAELVKAFDEYLKSRGEVAIITSGKRTPESQLEIIKDRIEQLGAVRKFTRLAEATVADAKVWLPAWRWLVAKHVPVNAPAAVPGVRVRTSAHLQGHAIDIISHDLDHLKGVVAGFMRSSFARQSDMKIGSILREPGCLHLTVG
jgi:hypothetical protein